MSSPTFPKDRLLRYLVIGLILALGIYWSLAAAQTGASDPPYPENQFLVTAAWLKNHLTDQGLVVVDVRDDRYFDTKLIPGAVHLPWSSFRYSDTARGIGGKFVGIAQAQKILGSAGLSRTDTLVLYDSIERDGGATATYVFWVLDLLGHREKKILESGIDDWMTAGGDVTDTAQRLEPMLYQAPADEIRMRRWVSGEFIQSRLGDPYYQILDVRSREEFLGEKPNLGLDGQVLKLGHIPTAVNVDYRLNWIDTDTKDIKSYRDLLDLYRGLDPSRSVITYCHSARRSSFGYFVLRLMGFTDVRLYDGSWFEWGHPDFFFPVETRENRPASQAVPDIAVGGSQSKSVSGKSQEGQERLEAPKGGYVSCGG
ncbi:MAG: rhodanese-like domain-containing protein [Desulfobacterales bacterium]